jgi:methionyl-tRNA synthetase
MHSFYGGHEGWGANLLFGGVGGLLGTVLGILLLATLALKGYSLWYAAKKDQKWWFIILLVVNTLGILEIIYLSAVVKIWGKKSAGTPASPSTEAKVQ